MVIDNFLNCLIISVLFVYTAEANMVGVDVYHFKEEIPLEEGKPALYSSFLSTVILKFCPLLAQTK